MNDGLIVEQLTAGVSRMTEALVHPDQRSYFYLVKGQNTDCLIDSGLGLGWTLADLPRDESKPLVVVATHSHYDHIGRFFEAGERLGHQSEAELFASDDPVDKQAFPYLDNKIVLADGGMLTSESYRIPASPLTGLISDGDRIELGGGGLEIIHTPGHSPGSLSLVDDRSGLLFCADTVHDGHIHDDIPGADRKVLLASHQRLLGRMTGLACPGHGAVMDRAAFQNRVSEYAESVEYAAGIGRE